MPGGFFLITHDFPANPPLPVGKEKLKGLFVFEEDMVEKLIADCGKNARIENQFLGAQFSIKGVEGAFCKKTTK